VPLPMQVTRTAQKGVRLYGTWLASRILQRACEVRARKRQSDLGLS
jgi:hypothetical protein